MKRSYSDKEGNDDVAENNSASGASNQTIPEIESPPLPPPPRQPRRRLPARKPYLQKHLNVAEARREVVAALKHHRAAAAIQPRPIIEAPRSLEFSGAYASKSPVLQGAYYPHADRSWICPQCYSPWPAVMLTPPPPPPDAGFHNFEVPWMGLGLKLDVEEFIGKPYSVYIDGAPPVETDEDEIGSPFNEEMAEFPPWINEEKQCVVDLQQDSSALPGLEIEEIDGVDGDWLN